jgi:uncharacterized membrane protein
MENSGAPGDSERFLVLLSYGLMLIALPMGGLTGLVGVVIAHVRLSHVLGSIHESHYRNLIRVFWTVLIFVLLLWWVLSFVVGASLFSLFWPWGWPFRAVMMASAWAMLALPLGFLSLAIVIWYYWRLLRGFVRELDDKPY